MAATVALPLTVARLSRRGGANKLIRLFICR